MKKAIIFGASGFVGSCLLTELLNNSDYEQVIIVVRKALGLKHPKLKTLIGDMNSLNQLKSELVADEIFLTIGTTKKHAPDEKQYYQIDHDYPLMAAKLAKEMGAKSVFIVTSVGANAKSPFFYIRSKGELERHIRDLDFQHTHIFRPSMILGNRIEQRSLEKPFMKIWGGLNSLLLGPLNLYKGIDGKQIARAMSQSAKSQTQKVKIYHWSEMMALNDLVGVF